MGRGFGSFHFPEFFDPPFVIRGTKNDWVLNSRPERIAQRPPANSASLLTRTSTEVWEVFDLTEVLPDLLRKDVEFGEISFPEVPARAPEIVDADPSWRRRWLAARERLQTPPAVAVDEWEAERKQRFGRLLAAVGWGELRHIVLGCAYAATRHEMPAAWRACIIKQAYEDMQHAASFITRGCRYSDENYWNGVQSKASLVHPTEQRILERDLGGFFAVVGLHTEAYSAEDGGIYSALLSLDPVLSAWSPHEIEQEAGHLSFLFPAMREYLNSGPREEQERKKLQMIADDNQLSPLMREADLAALEGFAINKLGLSRELLEWPVDLLGRRRHVYRQIGIEESYWPQALRL